VSNWIRLNDITLRVGVNVKYSREGNATALH
jgi:hypothetical protein